MRLPKEWGLRPNLYSTFMRIFALGYIAAKKKTYI